GLLYSFKRTSIHHKILYHWKSTSSKRFDNNCITILKFTHMELAGSDHSIGTVRFPVYLEATCATNPFPAIMIKYHRILTFLYKTFIQNVQHFKEGHIWIYITYRVS